MVNRKKFTYEVVKDKNNTLRMLKYLLDYLGIETVHIENSLKALELNFDHFLKLYRDTDLRITQSFVSSGILPNYQGMWYYITDEDLIVKTGIKEEREIYFWGRNYDKDMKPLKETEYIPIKLLNTNHIKNILKLDYISDKYRKLLNKELTLRNGE